MGLNLKGGMERPQKATRGQVPDASDRGVLSGPIGSTPLRLYAVVATACMDASLSRGGSELFNDRCEAMKSTKARTLGDR